MKNMRSGPVADDGENWPGLDVAYGLAAVSNKAALYRKLLVCYRESNLSSVQGLDDAFAAGDLSRLGRLAHTLKGTSGTLGMTALYGAALALEKAAGEADSGQVAALVAAVKAEQEKVLDSIERYLLAD